MKLLKLSERYKPLIFRGLLKPDENGNVMTPAAERGDVYMIDNTQFSEDKPLIFNGVKVLFEVLTWNDMMLSFVCTDKVEDAHGVDNVGLMEINKKWRFSNENYNAQFDEMCEKQLQNEEIPEIVKPVIVTAATEEGKIEVKMEISDLAEEEPFKTLKEPVIVPEETEKMFEEIERIENLMHATVKIQNPHLRKLLEDGGHICMCGSLIFTSFLPDDIRAAYCKWHSYKMMSRLVKMAVDDITETVDHAIVECIKDKCPQRRK